MRTCFERAGYKLLEACDADEAQLIAKAHPEPIDILVTDVVMPGMSGIQLAKRLRNSQPKLKTLFVSGYQPDHFEVDWAPNDSGELLAKPFLAPELLRRVRVLLERDTPVTQ